MVRLPYDDPGVPDRRSPVRFLLWVGRQQVPTLIGGVFFGVLWMLSQALMPFAIGAAIQKGIADHDNQALAEWTLVLLGLGVVQAVAGVLRHRFAVQNWIRASFRMAQIVGHHIARTGPAIRGGALDGRGRGHDLERRDARRRAPSTSPPGSSGAVVAYIVVAIDPARRRRSCSASSCSLGVPILVAAARRGDQAAPAAAGRPARRGRRAHRARRRHRRRACASCAASAASRRSSTATSRQSQDVRAAGVRVATPQSTLDAAQVLRPGPLRRRRDVDRRPLRARREDRHRRARRVLRLRGLPRHPAPDRRRGGGQDDARARRREADARRARDRACRPRPRAAGRGTAGRRPAQRPAVGARRRAGHDDGARLLGAARDGGACRPARALRRGRCRARRRPPRRPPARHRSPPDRRQRVRPGAVLGRLAPRARPLGARRRRRGRGRRSRSRTPRTSSRRCPSGLDAVIDERGRSFSGGQRQRLSLTRALLADAEILVLVEPTSAVDAHTEARIALRLRDARAGRTTVVVTASPLMLDRADRVVLVEDGRVSAQGSHRELLRRERALPRDRHAGEPSSEPAASRSRTGPELRAQARAPRPAAPPRARRA